MAQEKTKVTFEDWLQDVYVWPQDVSQTCTQLGTAGTDCLERNEPQLCASCAEYARACMDYESDQALVRSPSLAERQKELRR